MTFQLPAFIVDHPAADLPVESIDDSGFSTPLGEGERAFITNRRIASVISHAISSSPNISVDFGAAIALDRFVIPAGHNLNGTNLTFQSDTNGAFATPSARGSHVVTSGGVISSGQFALPTLAERFYRVLFTRDISMEISGFHLGNYLELSAGVRIAPGFEFSYETQLTESPYPGGNAVVELARPRRFYSLTVRDIDPATSDYSTLSKVLSQGRAEPFWYYPPDIEHSLDPGPVWVQLQGDDNRIQISRSPTPLIQYEAFLSMIEVHI